MRITVALVAIAFMCCARNDKHILLEIVGLNKEDPNNFSLQVVKSDFKKDPFSKNTQDFELISKVDIHLNEIGATAINCDSFAELRTKLQKSFGEQKADLLLTKSQGVYRGTTFESTLALSAYYHLMEINKFARALGLLDDIQAGPLRVGLYGDIYSDDLSDFPFPSSDNALYVGSMDTMVFLPVGENEGLPVSMHEGVLAHEYHHRIFFYKVWVNNGDKRSWERYKDRYRIDRNPFITRSERLLSATDEGLADIFAIAYTGLSNYLCLSLTSEKGDEICRQRDVHGSFAQVASYDLLASSNAAKKKALGDCQQDSHNFMNPSYNYYCLATVIAKVLYEASNRDQEILREFTLPAINRSLSAIGEALSLGGDYDVDIFFEALAKESRVKNSDFHRRLCQQLLLRFSSLSLSGRIPSCKF